MDKKSKRSFISILCVCTGNICRSPTAEAVFTARIRTGGLSERIRVDSAGTHRYHVGAPPDARATAAAAMRGYDLSGLRARQISASDFSRFDYIFYMDARNAEWLRERCPSLALRRLHALAEFAGLTFQEIPDPYYGTSRDFEETLDRIELAVDGALTRILAEQSENVS